MMFEKGKGRGKRREWRWGKEEIEEVKEIKYLEYILQKNGGAEKHIRERLRRAIIAMKNTWSTGEKLFKDNFVRRMKMFELLVESVALYGVEIWGWQYEEIGWNKKKVHKVDSRTRQEDTKLHISRGNENERNKNDSG